MSEFWDGLRRSTQARIGLGRVGNALPTKAELDFRAAHAAARDAVHAELDVAALAAALTAAGWDEPLSATSQAGSRAEYLRRPDLGRAPAGSLPTAAESADVAIVLADGLSARAVTDHAVGLLGALRDVSPLHFGVPVIATQARVGLGDHIGAALGARSVLVLIGERPGLSASDSLGAYYTYAPRPGRTDAERNCVSNIREPNGLSYGRAAAALAGLFVASFELGESGVRVKDRSRPVLPPGSAAALG